MFRSKCINNSSTLPYTLFRRYSAWLAISNLLLLTLCNMTILNPGPDGLSVVYHNVQGLIPFSELGNKHPSLNQTKLLELQSYAFSNSPDVLVLNETWLKSSIHDNEILPPNAYTIFRRDRSTKSHPPDPVNPKNIEKMEAGYLLQ